MENNDLKAKASASSGLEEIKPVNPKYAQEDAMAKQLGRPFLVGLLAGSTLLFCAILFLVWGLPHFASSLISPSASQIILTLISLIAGLALIFCGLLLTGLIFKTRIPFMQHLRGIMNWILFPLMRLLGILLRIPKSKIRLAFIRINNEFARISAMQHKPEELLILLPHCIQKSTCPHRLAHNIQNCTRCGACSVGHLLNLGDKYGVEVVIVPGGTVARQIVKDRRPKALIAVACHRDLTSGVRDVATLPVFGVVNQRLFGPCINTSVDVSKVEEAVRIFLRLE